MSLSKSNRKTAMASSEYLLFSQGANVAGLIMAKLHYHGYKNYVTLSLQEMSSVFMVWCMLLVNVLLFMNVIRMGS